MAPAQAHNLCNAGSIPSRPSKDWGGGEMLPLLTVEELRKLHIEYLKAAVEWVMPDRAAGIMTPSGPREVSPVRLLEVLYERLSKGV